MLRISARNPFQKQIKFICSFESPISVRRIHAKHDSIPQCSNIFLKFVVKSWTTQANMQGMKCDLTFL